jgi:hypothetical protein
MIARAAVYTDAAPVNWVLIHVVSGQRPASLKKSSTANPPDDSAITLEHRFLDDDAFKNMTTSRCRVQPCHVPIMLPVGRGASFSTWAGHLIFRSWSRSTGGERQPRARAIDSEQLECCGRDWRVSKWQHHTISDVRREFLPKKPFFRSRFFARRGGRNVGRLAHALSLP